MRCIVAFLIVCPLFLLAQEITPLEYHKALSNIEELKKGVLLFRLKTNVNASSQLKALGKDAFADKIQSEQDRVNKKIIHAFRTYFTFCPVYFFLSDQTDAVLSGKYNKVIFLNDSLIEDPAIHPEKKPVFTAEFGPIDESGMELNALIIEDDEFNSLGKPFPYYVRTYGGSRTPAETVIRMNKKLQKFYETSLQR